jgi:hypothetical protein
VAAAGQSGIAPSGSELPVIIPRRAAPSAAQHAHFQFGLASLMLTVTLCAVIMGAASIFPGLGIGLAILVTPAFIHTAVTAVRRREHGQRMDPVEKIVFFGGSLGAVVVTLVGAGIAFYATCWAGFFAGAAVGAAAGARDYEPISWGLAAGVLLGIVAGVWVLVLLIRMFGRCYRRRAG